MVSSSGFIFATLLGLTTRRFQLALQRKTSSKPLPYVFSSLTVIALYLGADHYAGLTRDLLQRRLAMLQAQRAQAAIFGEYTALPDHRTLHRGNFFRWVEQIGLEY